MNVPDSTANTKPDLRILALIDAKVLPPAVQNAIDDWRIFRARDAVVSTVKTAMQRRSLKIDILEMYLERLEVADHEKTIFEGIYAMAEVVEVYRKELGIHSQYVVLVMSGQINPWGLLTLQHDFEHPAVSVIETARELWRLVKLHEINVPILLKQLKPDDAMTALNEYYAKQADSPDAGEGFKTAPKDPEAKP